MSIFYRTTNQYYNPYFLSTKKFKPLKTKIPNYKNIVRFIQN